MSAIDHYDFDDRRPRKPWTWRPVFVPEHDMSTTELAVEMIRFLEKQLNPQAT